MQPTLWESILNHKEDAEHSRKICVWKEMFHFIYFPVMPNALKEVHKP